MYQILVHGLTRVKRRLTIPRVLLQLRQALMSRLLLILMVFLTSCSARIGLAPIGFDTATLRSAGCAAGGEAVRIASVTAMVNGEEFNNLTREDGKRLVLHLRPGTYAIEALCVRGHDGCGLRHAAVLYTDQDPSYKVRVSSNASVIADCDADGKTVWFSQ